MTIFLCGFMGCGKTRLGRVLAQLLPVRILNHLVGRLYAK